MSRTSIVVTLLPLFALVAAPCAYADDASQARRFTAAQSLFDAGAYTPALAEFEALTAETGSPNAELYVALCLRSLGRFPEAWEATTRALGHATERARQDRKYEATRDAAAAALAQLQQKVARLVLVVSDPPPGLVVHVNGTALASARLGVPIAVPAGEALVRVTAPGKRGEEHRVSIQLGELRSVTIVLTPAPEQAQAQVIPTAAPPPTGGMGRKVGYAVSAVGAAGMITFAIAGVAANQRYAALRDKCGDGRCTDRSLIPDIEGGKRLDLAANVGLGVGLAGLAGGALLIIFGGPKAAPPVSAWALPGGVGLTVRRTF